MLTESVVIAVIAPFVMPLFLDPVSSTVSLEYVGRATSQVAFSHASDSSSSIGCTGGEATLEFFL